MENLAMGGYGAYVWSSVGLGFTVIIICIVSARRRHARVLQEVKIRIAAMDKQT